MKSNLGKLVLYLLVFLNLEANEYVWSASINKEKAYVNQAVHLHYSCKFKDKDELHVIEFNPVGKYKDYDIYLLSESESIVDSKRVNDFEFVAFLKKSGHIDFEFDVLMKKTNQDSIENTVLGRDNAGYEEFTKKWIKQKKLSLEVLKTDAELVGEFSFEVKKDKPNVDAYEPYHFEIIIKGVGNFEHLKPVDLNISGAKVFSSKPKKNYKITKDGFKGEWSQKFAVVSDENFTFPKISYIHFEPNTKLTKEFVSEAFDVGVKQLYKKDELLDKEEVSQHSYFGMQHIYYFLFFVFGFLVGRVKLKKNSKKNANIEFEHKVNNLKNIDELLMFLVINDAKKYANIIKKIESKQIGLSEAKRLIKDYAK